MVAALHTSFSMSEDQMTLFRTREKNMFFVCDIVDQGRRLLYVGTYSLRRFLDRSPFGRYEFMLDRDWGISYPTTDKMMSQLEHISWMPKLP